MSSQNPLERYAQTVAHYQAADNPGKHLVTRQVYYPGMVSELRDSISFLTQ